MGDLEPLIRMALPQTLELRVERGPEVKRVNADRGQLEQVVLNLALNAQESMPGGGLLAIRTYHMTVDEAYAREHPAVKPGAYTVLDVSDTGPGLGYEPPPDLSQPRARSAALTDIGSIAAAIRQFDGFIWAASEFGRGTTFRIFLPALPASQGSTGA